MYYYLSTDMITLVFFLGIVFTGFIVGMVSWMMCENELRRMREFLKESDSYTTWIMQEEERKDAKRAALKELFKH